MTTSVFKALLVAGLVGALLALLPACGDGDGTGSVTIKSGGRVTVEVTPYASVPLPEGPLPTREADLATTCQKSDQKQWEEMPPMIIDPSLSYTAVVRTEKGDVTLKLYPEDAPWTVNNFVFLACQGFYDGLTFHRVFLPPLPEGIPHPFVQAGDPSGLGATDPTIGGPGYNIPTEISDRSFLKGTVGMASSRPGTPTSGSQFFIVLEDSPELDTGYTVFGEVVDGLEVLEQLTPRNPRDHGPPGDEILEITIQEE